MQWNVIVPLRRLSTIRVGERHKPKRDLLSNVSKNLNTGWLQCREIYD